ncbi:hypothetical protein A1O1_02997 [Capronia coronata CBS 617.96]|uniref:Uncharacterized protein n=1 Tax=Capronia coronata CBS 617.96 TaxID=1182541 RepID=W9YZ81_9EURO|nr:uncharacterized protein A1O1_02997 [Capronia coronata CBS 617.96]EXJ94601.1 hypothetical protein A1O1_02997 [Capronia coronata CBS 617.96]
MSQPSSTSSECLLPYKDRGMRDLSGIQQQFHLQELSTQSLDRPEGLSAPARDRSVGHPMGIPKSKTMSSLLSSPRVATPRRRLLQPLGPPLPRTQTLGSLSCFGPASLTPSPRKAPYVAMPSFHRRHDTSEINMTDALQESRMTEKEVQMMKQVQREAAANRTRLRNSFGNSPQKGNSGPDRSQISGPPTSKGIEDIATIRLPANDSGNARHLGGFQRSSHHGPFLFVNSTMANSNGPDDGPPTTTTVGSTASSCQSEGMNHINQVYSAENSQYWTGRYVSLCDHLRTEEMSQAKSLSPLDTTNRKAEHLLDNREKDRMRTALNELKGSCRTKEAVDSFEDFEIQLLKKFGVSRQTLHRTGNFSVGDINHDRKEKIPGRAGLKPVTGSNAPQSPRNSSATTSRISSVNAEAVMSLRSSKFYGNGGFAKSKTTGNLASLLPTIPKKQPVSTSSSATMPSTEVKTSLRRRTSFFDRSPETLNESLKCRKDQAAPRAVEASRRSTPRFSSFGFPKSESQTRLLSSSRIAVRPEQDRCESKIRKVNAFDSVVGSLDCAMLESGHPLPPLPTRDTGSPRVHVVKVPGGGREKLVKSRRKVDRQISGEIVRNFLGAGMREVKKMGRRVGGWGGSSEDLLLPDYK